jgi:hypothetical protein
MFVLLNFDLQINTEIINFDDKEGESLVHDTDP